MSYRVDDPSTHEAGNVLDERNLVLLAQRGDQLAFEKLYERYNDRISRYLIRMVGDDGVGCELSQETFLKAWEALMTLRDPDRFANWLYRIATNRAYNYQNHARLLRTVPWEEYMEHSASLSIAGPERLIEETELMKLVLARVSPTYRPCFILYVIEKLPQRQIADVLGIKLTSVAKYVSRGKEEFRQIYYRMTDEMHEDERRDRR
ncbi:MAG TPA: RNA polymerase sigma factor [Ktedonobacteraceae bacterium]|nr:RNA polymerase sigma factor [Ktedonobacteraceae bacterium]